MVKNKRSVALVLLLVLLLFGNKGHAQCGDPITCTYYVNSNTPASYTVNSGQLLCIESGFDYSGTITLNGGTICNMGTVHNVVFKSGIFNNEGRFLRSGSLNINNDGDLTFNCLLNSVIEISGAVDINAASSSYNIIFNQNGSIFSVTNSFNCSNGVLQILTPDQSGRIAGSPVIFNVGGQFNITNNASLTLHNRRFCGFNVQNAAVFEGKFNKAIINDGEMNFNNSFNIGGNGMGTGVFELRNSGNITVSGAFNASYNNGTTNIINSGRAERAFYIGQSYTQSKDNTTFTNNGTLFVELDCNITRGSLTNNSNLNARDVILKFGSLSNNFRINCRGDFETSNAVAIVNNNGLINVANSFSNKGNFNMSLSSYLRTNNYDNKDDGIITGPEIIESDEDYAKIFISGHSENSGYINGKVLIYDETLVGTNNNNGYGFDQVANASRISNNTAFAAKTVGPGPPATNCLLLATIFSVQASANPTTICPGASSNLTAQLMQKITIKVFLSTITFFIPVSVPSTAYTWLPAASLSCSNCQNPVASPATTTQYTVSVAHAGCTFTNVVTVTVLPAMTVNPPTTFYTAVNAPLVLGSTPIVSGGLPPYTYQWTQPSNISFNSASQNPVCTTAVNTTFNLLATDANGCTINQLFTVLIINGATNYAVFKRQLDAGYYQLTAGKLYFTLDGEYNSSTLKYKIIDEKRAIVTTPLPPPLTLSNGDNRYFIDLTTVGFSTANNNKFYTVEVLNEKDELFLLKIRYAQ